MKQTVTMPLIRRQVLAVGAGSLTSSISTLALILIWVTFESGVPDWHRVPRELGLLLVFVVPTAAAGITFFGLPLLFVLRRIGWISTISRFRFFGTIAGAFWAAAIAVLFELRQEIIWLMILIGSVNGYLVAWLWLNIVEKYRASERHQISIGEAS